MTSDTSLPHTLDGSVCQKMCSAVQWRCVAEGGSGWPSWITVLLSSACFPQSPQAQEGIPGQNWPSRSVSPASSCQLLWCCSLSTLQNENCLMPQQCDRSATFGHRRPGCLIVCSMRWFSGLSKLHWCSATAVPPLSSCICLSHLWSSSWAPSEHFALVSWLLLLSQEILYVRMISAFVMLKTL